MKIEDANCNKRRKNVNQYNTSCNLQRNIETTKSKNVSWTRWKMQMQKQNYQEMYQHVKLQLLKMQELQQKSLLRCCQNIWAPKLGSRFS